MKAIAALDQKALGLYPDLLSFDLPSDGWSRGRNVRFQDNVAETAHGRREVYPPVPARPLFAVSTDTADGPYLFWCSANKCWRVRAGDPAHEDITPVGGLVSVNPRDWQGFATNYCAFVSNGQDVPLWKGSLPGDAAPLPDFGTYFGAARPLTFSHARTFLFVGGTTVAPDAVYWSTNMPVNAPPASWTPSLSNLAGSVIVGGEQGPIVCTRSLRDALVVYKAHATHVLNFVGGTFVWSLRQAFNNVGCLSRDAVVDIAGFHYMLTDGDVVRHDGNSIQSIAQGRIRRTLFAQMGDLKAVQLIPNHQRRELWLFTNTDQAGDLAGNVAWIYDLDTGTWGQREMDRGTSKRTLWAFSGFEPPASLSNESWEDDATPWTDGVQAWYAYALATLQDATLGAEELSFVVYDTGQDQIEPGVEASIAKEGMDCGSPALVKWARRLTLVGQAVGTTELQVRCGGQMRLTQPISWGSWITVPAPVTGSRVWVDARGRFLSVEVRERSGGFLRLASFQLEYSELGRE